MFENILNPWFIDKILVLWPLLISLSTFGWGILFSRVVLPKAFRCRDDNSFNYAFAGVFVIILIVIVINFEFPLGIYTGRLFAGIGIPPLLYKIIKNRNWDIQLLILFFWIVILSLIWREMGYGYDAGLYHIPYMNWIAYEPLPLGLTNLEGRLGFNSTWLAFCSAYRLENYLEWRHLIHAEISISSLSLAWATWMLYKSRSKIFSDRWIYHLISFFILIYFIHKIGGDTGTDRAANLLAYCAWIAFSDYFLKDELISADDQYMNFWLITILSSLAISIKLSLLPILILPVYIIYSCRLYTLSIFTSWHSLIFISTFWVCWLSRGVMLSGCMIYPGASSCFDLPWAVPAANVQDMSQTITAWARAPGEGYTNYMYLLNISWIPSWFRRFSKGVLFQSLIASVFIYLFTVFFVKNRESNTLNKPKQRHWTSVSAAVSIMGIIFWFIKAPDDRFSWAFFAIACATIVISAVYKGQYILPDLQLKVVSKKFIYIISMISVITGYILMTTHRSFPSIPSTNSIESRSANGWMAARPVSGDQCWTDFPCSPSSIDKLIVEKGPDRFIFSKYK